MILNLSFYRNINYNIDILCKIGQRYKEHFFSVISVFCNIFEALAIFFVFAF